MPLKEKLRLLERMTYDQLFRLSEPGRIDRSASVRGPAVEVHQYQDGAMYVFNAKSNPSTTGLRHKCYVKFFRPRRPLPLDQVECLVDCACPDHKYRTAWVLKQHGSSNVGPNSLNQAHNRAPRITNPSARPGLCKHLLAMRKYIYDQIDSFDSDVPYDSRRLDQLTRQARRRWVDWNGALLQGQIRTQMNRNLANARRAERERNLAQGFPTGGEAPPETPPDLPPETGEREPGELEDSQVVMGVNKSTLTLLEEVETEIAADAQAGQSSDDEALELLRTIADLLGQLVNSPEPEPLAPDDGTDEENLKDLEQAADGPAKLPPRAPKAANSASATA